LKQQRFVFVLGIFFLATACTPQNQNTVSTPAPKQPSVQTKDPNCLYIPESSVPKGVSYGDYKNKVKRETGAKCVFFTGG
jgi:hypothetical protein